jgi:hypothetical protein
VSIISVLSVIRFFPFSYLRLHQATSLKYTVQILQLIPILLDCLSMLNKDTQDKDTDTLYSLLLVLSGILTDKNGKAKCKFLFFLLLISSF